MAVSWRKDGIYGFVLLDNPPVNAINREIRQGLLEAVDWAEKEGLERVILSGAGPAFAAGADAKEFDRAPEAPYLPDVLNHIESSTVPWIAALHGAVLGGGAELALACRARVARSDASIGFPEVILGLVPGAGGTQRLPRLVGLDEALKLVPTGKAINGRQAKDIGLVDEVDDDPLVFATMTKGEWLGMAVPVGALNAGEIDETHYESASAFAKKRMRRQIAPLKAIDLLRVAGAETLEAGMKRERDVFLDLRQSDQARALRHIFFAERGAKIPSDLTPEMKTPDHVAVVGGGTMGVAIAYAFLNAGVEIVVLETDADGLARASTNIEALISNSLSMGRIDEADNEHRGDAPECRHMWRIAREQDINQDNQRDRSHPATPDDLDELRDLFCGQAFQAKLLGLEMNDRHNPDIMHGGRNRGSDDHGAVGDLEELGQNKRRRAHDRRRNLATSAGS